MKNKLKNLFGITLLMCVLALVSCQKVEEVDLPGEASVTIERESISDLSKFRVKFTPTENTSRFEYAIGFESDRAAFEDGSFSGILSQDGNEPMIHTFEGLEVDDNYTVFAKAYDENGKAGAVTSIKNTPFTAEIKIEQQFLTNTSTAFTFSYPALYYKCRYYLGTAEDKEAFLKDEVESGNLVEIFEAYTVNFFDLEPEKEYVLYAIAYDIMDIPSNLFEIKFTTLADGSFPDATAEVVESNAYTCKVRLKPNDLCGTIVATIAAAGEMDDLFFGKPNGRGDIANTLINFLNYNMASSAKDGAELVLEAVNESLTLDKEYNIYVLLLDNEYNISSVKIIDVKGASKDETAGTAEATIELNSIEGRKASYTIKLNDAAMGCFYNTFDKKWLDNLSLGSELDNYLHEHFIGQPVYFGYGEKEFKLDDTTVYYETEYYAIACPVNKNGVEGWGATEMVSFKTPADME